MRDNIDYVIENKAASCRAKTISKKNNLINEIYKKLNIKLSKALTIKELNAVLNG